MCSFFVFGKMFVIDVFLTLFVLQEQIWTLLESMPMLSRRLLSSWGVTE